MSDCTHPKTKRGKNIPRRWGSYQSEVCRSCGAFRSRSHGKQSTTIGHIGDWRPAAEYAEATTEQDLD